MTDQLEPTSEPPPTLTVADVQQQRYQLQHQREEMTARLRIARGKHVEVAYLAATQEGYADAEAAAAAEVRKLEAALSHQATIEAGALQAEEAARAHETQERQADYRARADEHAGKAMAAADCLDQAMAGLVDAWGDLKRAWRSHGTMVLSLVDGESVATSVSLANDRERQLLIAVSERLARRGMELPEVRLSGEAGRQSFASTVRGMLVHVRRAGRQSTKLTSDDDESELPSGIEGDAEGGFTIGSKATGVYYEPWRGGGLTAEEAGALAGPQPMMRDPIMPSGRMIPLDAIDPNRDRYAEL